MSSEPFFNDLDHLITSDEVTSSIKILKNRKAVGLDVVSSEILKSSLPCMGNLFNAILCKGQYPKSSNSGFITSLHKNGSLYDTSNYRGLTINSTLSKVFNSILNSRLEKYVENHNILTNKQIGFRKGARTSDHLFTLRTLIEKYNQCYDGQKLYVCFVFFRKAYDSVWRRGLLYKLLKLNVRGKFYKIIENMMSNVSFAIKQGDKISGFVKTKNGVKQGDVMRPLLFNLFINDLPEHLGNFEDTPVLNNKFINCLMYADDLVIFSKSARDYRNH